MASDSIRVHGTAIAVGGRAILIRGPSGCGKSDLALRTLAVSSPVFAGSPPELVADDQVIVERADTTLRLRAPDVLRNLLEVRGIGILPFPSTPTAELALVADIVPAGEIERLPDPPEHVCLLGIDLPLVRIAAFEPSAPLKLLLALATRHPTPA